MKEHLDALRREGVLTDLDVHFARTMARLAGDDSDELFLGATLVSNRTGAGDVCVDLTVAAERTIYSLSDGRSFVAPALTEWARALRAASVVGVPGDYRPLVLDEHNRLYLYRYWDYERRLAADLLARAAAPAPDCDAPRLRDGLNRLFPGDSSHEVDWQKVAAFAALRRRLCVISGGPGTGKTTTLVRILALLVEQSSHAPPAIALAAPTGKAAARMREALVTAKAALPVAAAVGDAIPEEASTLHRLLGVRPDGTSFRHHKDNPLPVAVLVVDEASMVDLALMTRLVEALPVDARMILLGDKDQLASVEAGSVLADICGDAPSFSLAFAGQARQVAGTTLEVTRDAEGVPLADSVVVLRKSYRFGSESGIGSLARAVNAGDHGAAVGMLDDTRYPDITCREYRDVTSLREHIRLRVVPQYLECLQAVRDGADATQIFAAFNRIRVLAAHRAGPRGVDALNALVESALEAGGFTTGRETWYPGRPVMVSRNDYTLRLFNGDVGIALPDPEADGSIRVFFQGPAGTMRRFYPGRLPEHHTVYAMTVHKSQGSEFDEVILVLPDEVSAVVSRELVYTGITRARHRIEIWSSTDVLQAALARRTMRASGLHDRLWPRP